MPTFGGGVKCGRCGKSVYPNEEIIAAGSSWHTRGCFTCNSNTVTEKKSDTEGEAGEIYCKGCFGRQFGPTGYGYGGGAGALANTGK